MKTNYEQAFKIVKDFVNVSDFEEEITVLREMQLNYFIQGKFGDDLMKEEKAIAYHYTKNIIRWINEIKKILPDFRSLKDNLPGYEEKHSWLKEQSFDLIGDIEKEIEGKYYNEYLLDIFHTYIMFKVEINDDEKTNAHWVWQILTDYLFRFRALNMVVHKKKG